MIPVQIMMRDAAARRMYLDTAINPSLNMPASPAQIICDKPTAFTLLKILGSVTASVIGQRGGQNEKGFVRTAQWKIDEKRMGELRRRPPNPREPAFAATCPAE